MSQRGCPGGRHRAANENTEANTPLPPLRWPMGGTHLDPFWGGLPFGHRVLAFSQGVFVEWHLLVSKVRGVGLLFGHGVCKGPDPGRRNEGRG